MRKEFVSRQQVDLIPERLRKVEETDASKELNIYLRLKDHLKFEEENIVVTVEIEL